VTRVTDRLASRHGVKQLGRGLSRSGHMGVRARDLPAAVVGPPVPERGEEGFFGRRQGPEACAWALAGGVAVHGDFGGGDTDRPLRVLGQLTVLLEWGRLHGLTGRSPRALDRRYPPHFVVSGGLARELARRAREGGEVAVDSSAGVSHGAAALRDAGLLPAAETREGRR
jgi:hypothetical protein